MANKIIIISILNEEEIDKILATVHIEAIWASLLPKTQEKLLIPFVYFELALRN